MRHQNVRNQTGLTVVAVLSRSDVTVKRYGFECAPTQYALEFLPLDGGVGSFIFVS